MKTLKCDLCEHKAQGETFEEWMNALMPHYMQDHADVMKGKEGQTQEEQQAEMQKWMIDNKARFEAA